MKRIIIVLLSCTLLTPAAFADNKDNSNFRFSPIGLIVGEIAVNYDFAISDNWTIGPELAYWHGSDSESGGFTSDFAFTAYGIGARANWFKNGKFTDGLYVGPSIDYASAKVTTSDIDGSVSASASVVLVGCLVGYGWFWNSFNQMLGIGASIALGSTSVSVTDGSGTTTDVSTNLSGLAAEYSLGWTF